MENKELVVNALKYHDKNNEIYAKTFKNIKFFSNKISEHDLEHSVITFYDKNKIKLFESRYEIIGMYNPIADTWIWGWAIPTLRKNQTGLIKKVLNYGMDLDIDNISLKSELITSRFKIINETQLDIHIAIASYISKNKAVIGMIDDNVEQIKHENIDLTPIPTSISDNTISIHYLYLLDLS